MSNPKFKRGQKVTLKDDKSKNKNVGRIVTGPPVIIGDSHNPRGIFPIEIKNYVIISWGSYRTIEKISNITVLDRRRTK